MLLHNHGPFSALKAKAFDTGSRYNDINFELPNGWTNETPQKGVAGLEAVAWLAFHARAHTLRITYTVCI